MREILVGDCRETLKGLPDNSVNCVITSPPYFGLRDYKEDKQIGQEDTPEEFINNLISIFEEIKRVLKDDGTIWVNLGDSYNGSGKGALANGKAYGTGKQATNKGTQIGTFKKTDVSGLKQKDLIGIPWMFAFAMRNAGWYLRQDIIWNKPNAMPESVKDRCTKSHEYIFLFSKNKKYYYDYEAIKEPCSEENVKDFLSRKKKDNKGKGIGTYDEERPDLTRSRDDYMPKDFKRNKRSVWSVNTKPYKEAHFATFPAELIEPCVLAGCPEGGTILDPFGGSGTTAGVAIKNNRNAIICELNPDYVSLIDDRINSIVHNKPSKSKKVKPKSKKTLF